MTMCGKFNLDPTEPHILTTIDLNIQAAQQILWGRLMYFSKIFIQMSLTALCKLSVINTANKMDYKKGIQVGI